MLTKEELELQVNRMLGLINDDPGVSKEFKEAIKEREDDTEEV